MFVQVAISVILIRNNSFGCFEKMQRKQQRASVYGVSEAFQANKMHRKGAEYLRNKIKKKQISEWFPFDWTVAYRCQ